MKTTESSIDLSRLAVQRDSAETSSHGPPRRNFISKVIVPGGILLGFIALLAAAARQHLVTRPKVTVIPVIVDRAAVQQGGTPMFQAAGWVEPRPTSVRVAALTGGIVEELLVVEGQDISKDEPIARLIDVDAQLAVERAQAAVEIRQAELDLATAEYDAARLRRQQPVHLQAQLAEAEGQLARAETEFQKLPFLIDSAEAEHSYADRNYEGKQSARGAVAGVIVDKAERDLLAAKAKLNELQQRGPNLHREISSLQDRVQALSDQLRLLVEERRQEAEAKARVAAANAFFKEAKLKLQQAELDLQRTVIRAPMDGRVLRLVAAPGTQVSGQQREGSQNASTVVEMYDPQRLQIRADVRLEDVPQVIRGAPVTVRTASSTRPIDGRVLQVTSSANVQKNTLEVKVELLDPPPTVSPEMLVTATFLSADVPPTDSDRETAEQILVPEQLVQREDGRSWIWTVDASGRAHQATIRLGDQIRDELIEVLEGLNPTSRLVTSGAGELTDGQQVEIEAEDQRIGR